uniref:Uncharacterized protein n=1 Tax=Anguilla anguilla TaxID=7936 RepID=A0A0E9QY61_ANGAN
MVGEKTPTVHNYSSYGIILATPSRNITRTSSEH